MMLRRLEMVCLVLASWILCLNTTAQTNRPLKVGISNAYFIGGEYNTTYNTLLGVVIDYSLFKKNRFDFYANSGFSTDLDGDGTSLSLIDLSLGAAYEVVQIKERPLTVHLSAGGLYSIEKFATGLIEGNAVSSFNDFGFLADVGIGYTIIPALEVRAQLIQYDTRGTACGVQLFYIL